MGYKIAKIEIESFSGVKSALSLDLNESIILIKGNNGTGKTSIMRAIEFALFGKISEMQGSHYSTKKEEVINKFHEEKVARVSLKLQNDNSEIVIERLKTLYKRDSELIKFEENGQQFPEPLEKSLSEWISMQSELFNYMIYLNQVNFQQILDLKPKDRNEAFSAMLNLKEIDTVVTEFNSVTKKYKTEMKELESKSNSLADDKSKAVKEVSEASNQLEDLKKQFTIGSNFDLIQEKKQLKEKIVNLGHNIQSDELTKIISIVENEIDKLKESNHSLGENPELLEIKGLENTVIQIKTSIDEIKLKCQESNFTTITDLDTDKLELEKEEIDGKIQEMKKSLDEKNSLNKFLNMALNEVVDLYDDKCPFCETSDYNKSKVKAELTNRISQLSSNEIDSLQELIKMDMKKVEEIRNQIENLARFRSSIINLNDELREELRNLFNRLAKQEMIDDSILNLVNENKIIELPVLLELENYLNSISNALKEKHTQLESKSSDLDSNQQIIDQHQKIIDKLGQLISINEKELVLKNINEKIKTLDNSIDENKVKKVHLQELISDIESAAKILVETQIYYIEQTMNSVNPKIKLLLQKLQPHTYWKDLLIKLDTKKTGGGISPNFNILTTKHDQEDPVNLKAYFSRGQSNRSVLALLLALNSVVDTRFNFQLLDDVTQSLDGEAVLYLAESCEEISKDIQLIVSTADERFSSALEEKFLGKPDFKIYELTNWTENQGVSIKQ
jgi:DNA repair exonuclease SbcCD ATPase subunit